MKLNFDNISMAALLALPGGGLIILGTYGMYQIILEWPQMALISKLLTGWFGLFVLPFIFIVLPWMIIAILKNKL